MDKKLRRKFSESYLRDDGCFLARMIGIHTGGMAITDRLDTMCISYKLKECGSLDNAQDVESIASDPNTRLSLRTFRRQTNISYITPKICIHAITLFLWVMKLLASLCGTVQT